MAIQVPNSDFRVSIYLHVEQITSSSDLMLLLVLVPKLSWQTPPPVQLLTPEAQESFCFSSFLLYITYPAPVPSNLPNTLKSVCFSQVTLSPSLVQLPLYILWTVNGFLIILMEVLKLCCLKTSLLLKMIEDSKEFWLMWVLSVSIYSFRKLNPRNT